MKSLKGLMKSWIADKGDTFQQITLNEGEQKAFAQAALGLRWDAGKEPITAQQLTRPRRFKDTQGLVSPSFAEFP